MSALIPKRLFFIGIVGFGIFCVSNAEICSAQQPEPRYALVIGNANYEDVGKLKNPGNDAADIAAALASLDFAVDLVTDADLPTMEASVDRLGERLPVENLADEFGQLALVINDALARLERAFDTLRRFTADASHELRTPLTAIRSVGEVGLRERRSETEYREMIGSILEETERLTTMTDSLLLLSRADAGRADLRRATIDLTDLAREVAADLDVLAEEKRQQVRVVAAAEVDVVADRMTLRQAVLNLLDNAIKHSPEEAAIEVVVRRAGTDAVLEVIDNGPGIAPEHLSHVFERFYRADRARSRSSGGAGLGLAIARWAVEANGGRVEVESEVHHGSLFRIVLRAAAADGRIG